MRQPVPAPARSQARLATVAAPTRGLVRNVAVAEPDPRAAEVLENWIPTQRGIRMRGGLKRAAFVTDPVTSLFAYNVPTSPKFYAATADAIYDITSLDPVNAASAVVQNQAAGYYSTQQIGTSGGEFIYAVNGADFPWRYDGADWNPVTDEAVNDLAYDGGTADFSVGETVTGGTSSASATILGVLPSSATAGVLKIGAVTGGPFQDDEAITSAAGAAVADGAETSASSVTIDFASGSAATSDLSQVWLYRNRLFFVEKDTQTAWYLPVNSIGGTLNAVVLSAVFQRGGALWFGATWSLDAGDGIDDKCVFVSTLGEVAVYEGANPSDANDWRLVGRYDVAKPLGINATMQAGGDLLIATEDGIVPLSQVIAKDPAALSLAAVTRPIEPIWAFEVTRNEGSVELLKWTARNLGVVALPSADRTLAVNLQTGAWATQEGWEAQCIGEFDGAAYIGRTDGRVFAIDESGLDDTTPFTARYMHSFSDGGAPTAYKRAQMVRCTFFSPETVTYDVAANFDYNTDFGPAPAASEVAALTDYMTWDADNWDEKLWWSPAIEQPQNTVTTEWRTVTGAGNAMAPAVQVTSGSSQKLNIELVRVDFAFEVGGSVV